MRHHSAHVRNVKQIKRRKEGNRTFFPPPRSRRTETEQKRQQKSREEEELKQPSARERALEFAKTIPKPKIRRSVSDATSYDDIPEDDDDISSLAAPVPSRLDILRARHRELQAKVDFARNSIGL
eukprot:g4050.t1